MKTLSKLIEACGEDFYDLIRIGEDEWEANNMPTSEGYCPDDWQHGEGSTPEEAVANLILVMEEVRKEVV